MADRTFKLTSPMMTGRDVEAWQEYLVERFERWNIPYPLKITGRYDQATRSATASFLRAWGAVSAADAMKHGVTPWWRTKVRQDRRSITEAVLFRSPARVDYRRALRNRYKAAKVASPLGKILQDSWGWVPGVHDGLDLICHEDAPLLAICDGEIVRVSSSGWWGKGAQPSPGHPVSDGDGVIILRCGVNAGPFRKGLNIVYGHAEHATVKVGQKVRAGQVIGRAGYAVAPHVHLCVNGRKDTKGVGDRDPEPYYRYARRHG